MFDPSLPCVDLLPPTKSDRAGIRWHPRTRRLVIEGKRSSCEYAVEELIFDVPGRAFRLTKVDPAGGSDPESDSYTVTCGRLPRDTACECKGFVFGGRWCKHLSAVSSLLNNRWV